MKIYNKFLLIFFIGFVANKLFIFFFPAGEFCKCDTFTIKWWFGFYPFIFFVIPFAIQVSFSYKQLVKLNNTIFLLIWTIFATWLNSFLIMPGYFGFATEVYFDEYWDLIVIFMLVILPILISYILNYFVERHKTDEKDKP